MRDGKLDGMQDFDTVIKEFIERKIVSVDEGLAFSTNQNNLLLSLKGLTSSDDFIRNQAEGIIVDPVSAMPRLATTGTYPCTSSSSSNDGSVSAGSPTSPRSTTLPDVDRCAAARVATSVSINAAVSMVKKNPPVAVRAVEDVIMKVLAKSRRQD